MITEEVGTSSDMVVNKCFVCLFLAEFFEWIRPKEITHEAMRRWLTETINLW